MQIGRVAPVELDLQHGTSNTSFITGVTVTSPPEELDPLTIDEAAEALFEEARQRARHRRRRIASLATGLALAALLLAAVLVDGGGRHESADRGPVALPTSPEHVLSETPYMGVSCFSPCDRVGLAVWTRKPVRSVIATIGERSFELADPEWSGPRRHGLRRKFAGFLDRAGLRGDGPLAVATEDSDIRDIRLLGDPPVWVRVRLVVAFADGTRRTTTLRVQLLPGWG